MFWRGFLMSPLATASGFSRSTQGVSSKRLDCFGLFPKHSGGFVGHVEGLERGRQRGKGDLYTVSKLLGHCNIRTTQIYNKIVDENKRKVVDITASL